MKSLKYLHITLMKKTLLLLLFFATVLPIIAQEKPNRNEKLYDGTEPTFTNQFEFDIEFVELSFGYNHRIYKNLFLGINLGFGAGKKLIINNINNTDATTNLISELTHLSIQIQYSNKNFTTEISPSMVIFYDLFNSSNTDLIVSIGSNIGFFIGKDIKIGIRGFVGIKNGNIDGDIDETIIATSLIVLKIPIRW